MDPQLVQYFIGPAGAAGLTLLLVLLGQLVPKRYHQKALEENKRLQDANDALAAANEQLRQANNQLSSSGQLINQVMTILAGLAAGRQAVLPVQAPPGNQEPPGKAQ